MEEALEDFQFNRITHRTASLADRAAMGQFEKPDALAEIQNPEGARRTATSPRNFGQPHPIWPAPAFPPWHFRPSCNRPSERRHKSGRNLLFARGHRLRWPGDSAP